MDLTQQLKEYIFVNKQLSSRNQALEKEIEQLKLHFDEMLQKRNVWQKIPTLNDDIHVKKSQIQVSGAFSKSSDPITGISSSPSRPTSFDVNLLQLSEQKNEKLEEQIKNLMKENQLLQTKVTTLEQHQKPREDSYKSDYKLLESQQLIREQKEKIDFLEHQLEVAKMMYKEAQEHSSKQKGSPVAERSYREEYLKEIGELRRQLNEMTKMKNDWEKKFYSKAEDAKESDSMLQQKDIELERLKNLVTQLDLTQQEMVASLKSAEERAASNKNNAEKVLHTQEEMSRKLTSQSYEIDRMKKIIGTLDREKDALILELGEKDKKLELILNSSKETNVDREKLQRQLVDTQDQIEKQSIQLQRKDMEIDRLREQLSKCVNDIEMLTEERQMVSEQVGNVQDDLKNMTQENQLIHSKAAKIAEERDKIKRQLEETIGRVVQAEQLLKSKEQEFNAIMNNYKTVTNENSRAAIVIENLERENNDYRHQIELKKQEIEHIIDRLRELDTENQRQLMDLQSFQYQTEKQSKQIAEYQEALQRVQREKDKIQTELSRTTSVTLDLEHSKNEVHREALMYMKESENLKVKFDEAKGQIDELRRLLHEEKLHTIDLEKSVSELRVKEVVGSSTEQELRTEIGQLHERIRQFEAENNRLMSNIEEAHTRTKKLQDKLTLLENTEKKLKEHTLKNEKQTSIIQKLTDDITSLKNHIVKYEAEVMKNTQEIANYKDQIHALQIENEKLKKEQERFKQMMGKKDQSATEDAETMLRLRERETQLTAQLRSIREELHKIQGKYIEAKQDNTRLQDLISKVDSDRDAIQKEYNILLENERRLQETVRRIQNKQLSPTTNLKM